MFIKLSNEKDFKDTCHKLANAGKRFHAIFSTFTIWIKE